MPSTDRDAAGDATGPLVRQTLHFAGHVQGVGFRYATVQLARGYTVAGYVQNLPDGRVQVVVEGERSEIERFLAALHHALGHTIRTTQRDTQPPNSEFGPPRPGGLTIRY